MKKVLIATLSTAMVFGMVGCAGAPEGNGAENTTDTSIMLTEENVDKPLTGGQDIIGEDPAGATDIISSENPSENPAALPSDTLDDQTNAVPGTWQTNTLNPTENGGMEPLYYVQFTSSEIKYGKMKDGEFVEDHSDKISHLEKTVDGKYLVQAETKSGQKYTFKTSESDANTLEYYGTWTEAEYAANYSATGSLTKAGSEAKG